MNNPSPRSLIRNPKFEMGWAAMTVENSMDQSPPHLPMLAWGIFTTILTAAVLWAIERFLNTAIYTWTAWLIIPVGAFPSGIAAVSGYVFAAKRMNVRPGRAFLLPMILLPAASWILLNYFAYARMEVEGRRVKDVIPFSKYLDWRLRRSSYRIGENETGELGDWGYAMATVQLLGFALGGIGAYFHLTTLPYCTRCQCYLRRVGERERHFEDPKMFRTYFDGIASDLAGGRAQAAIDRHAHEGSSPSRSAHLCALLKIHACPSCRRHVVRLEARKRKNLNDWEALPNGSMIVITETPIMLAPVKDVA